MRSIATAANTAAIIGMNTAPPFVITATGISIAASGIRSALGRAGNGHHLAIFGAAGHLNIERKENMPQPPFKKTKKQASEVQLLVAVGLSERDIHARLGISRDTLRAYYSEELENGRAVKAAENAARLEKAANTGNVAAMKALQNLFDGGSKAPNSAGYVGKKQQQTEAAKTAGGAEWGDDLRATIKWQPAAN